MIGKAAASWHIQRLQVLPVGADGDIRRLVTVVLFPGRGLKLRLVMSRLFEGQAFGSGSGCAALKAGCRYRYCGEGGRVSITLLNPAHNPMFRRYSGTKHESSASTLEHDCGSTGRKFRPSKRSLPKTEVCHDLTQSCHPFNLFELLISDCIGIH